MAKKVGGSVGKKVVKAIGGLIGLVLLIAVFAELRFEWLSRVQYRDQVPAFTIHEEVVKGDLALGKRIFEVRAGCIECHGADLTGKLVMDNGAIGSIAGANITPYALKSWSDEEVARAIRYGVHQNGRSLRFMPSYDFSGMSKSDIASVIAYVRSIPEVTKPSHENTFGPMARILSALGQMPVMFPAREMNFTLGFADKPTEAPNAQFGKYLANACVGCHGDELRGGKIPGGDPAWPPAANIRLGANPSVWTEQAFRQTIATGMSSRTGATLRIPMPVNLLKQMNEVEIKALWEFLKELK